LVSEAGGTVNDFIADNGLHLGGKIIAASPKVFALLDSFFPTS
jgi:myo-inositol-1(or 4)-monophosphatase